MHIATSPLNPIFTIKYYNTFLPPQQEKIPPYNKKQAGSVQTMVFQMQIPQNQNSFPVKPAENVYFPVKNVKSSLLFFCLADIITDIMR